MGKKRFGWRLKKLFKRVKTEADIDIEPRLGKKPGILARLKLKLRL
jgi:hypothetical protein